MQTLIEPLIVSWGYESEKPGASRFIDEQEWTGTRDIAAYLTTPAAIEFFEEHDWKYVRAECHRLAQYARAQISALTNRAPLSPDSIEWYSQMFSVPLPPCEATELKARLYDEYHIEVPIVLWRNQPFIRVSIQAYNTRYDVDKLVDALARLLNRK